MSVKVYDETKYANPEVKQSREFKEKGLKKVTKATIKKAIKECNMQFKMFNISKESFETKRFDDIEKGNKEVLKVLTKLSTYGKITYRGFKTGYGTWMYRFNVDAQSFIRFDLVSNNID